MSGQHNHAAETDVERASAALRRLERRHEGYDESDFNDFALIEQTLAAAEARLAETERQRDEARETLAASRYWARKKEDRIERLEAAAARAEEALRQYGSHRTSCAYPDCGACDCGFATALSAGAEGTAG